jgi:hypothetical protein
MRYVSLVFIAVMMWWSWSVIKAPALLSEDTHIGLQDDLRRVITEYIQENLQVVADVKFEKFWTQTLKENQVKATFSYSFEDTSDKKATGGARIGVEGYAILNRIKDQNSEFDVWSLDELNVLNNRVIFKDGVLVNGSVHTDR